MESIKNDTYSISPVNIGKKDLTRNKLQDIFSVFFGIVDVSGKYSEKFAQVGPGRFPLY